MIWIIHCILGGVGCDDDSLIIFECVYADGAIAESIKNERESTHATHYTQICVPG